MKAKYFKKNFGSGEIMTIVKIKGGNSLAIYNDRMCIYNTLGDAHYKAEGYKKSNAKEFAEFHAQTMKNFNEILN